MGALWDAVVVFREELIGTLLGELRRSRRNAKYRFLRWAVCNAGDCSPLFSGSRSGGFFGPLTVRPDFWDIHDFSGDGGVTYNLIRRAQRVVGTTQLWIGEAGYATTTIVSGCGGVPYSNPYASPDTLSQRDCELSGGYWHSSPAVCEAPLRR